MKQALEDLSLWQKEPFEDKESELLVKELLRIELIANTIHYAETFASVLLAMQRYKRFHKFLLKYQVAEIKEFYQNIPKRRSSYIAKILQYPQMYQVKSPELRNDFKKSIEDAHDELKILGEFYLNWLDFYNSYKHGFRVFASKPNPDDDFTVSCILDKEKLNAFKIEMTTDSIDKSFSLCEFMFKFLSNVESTFSQRVLQKKDQFEMQLFTKNKKTT
ncbi:MAG: hypothetical protein KGH85_07790 [Thaumarchaeota archaeon]|nr:hypothetical protein [Nitrososphaerota archaeon]